jgi:bacteriorhodopsin
MDPLNPIETASSRNFSFNSEWMWPVVIVAALFVGYLCFDAWMSYRRQKRLNERKEEARKNEQSN